jgi:hypothetical protein
VSGSERTNAGPFRLTGEEVGVNAVFRTSATLGSGDAGGFAGLCLLRPGFADVVCRFCRQTAVISVGAFAEGRWNTVVRGWPIVVRVHGQPGTPMDTIAQQYGSTARRPEFFEHRAFAAVRAWPESLFALCHLSRGLVRLDHVTGAALGPLPPGLLPMLPEPTSVGPRVLEGVNGHSAAP